LTANLSGTNMILVTRPYPAGQQLVSALNSEGIAAYHCPLFTIDTGKDSNIASQMINRLPPHSIIIALSQHAVIHLEGMINPNNHHYYLAVGQTTAELLQQKVNRPVI